MWTDEDKITAEEEVEGAVSYFEHDQRTDALDSKWRRKGNAAITFLKDNFPESYILETDYHSSVINS